MNVRDPDLARCLDGDRDAWEAFVGRTAAVVHAAVRRVLGGPGGRPDEVDDAVQDVYLRLVRDDFRLLRTYDPDRAALTTWLTLVARSAAIDRARRKRRTTQPLLEDDRVQDDARAGFRHEPELPMEVLTERQRVVLALLFDGDLPVSDVARLLGVDDQTVRSTKHKALTRLRQRLEELDRDDGTAGGPARGMTQRQPS